MIILIVLIVIAAGLLIYFYFKNKSSKPAPIPTASLNISPPITASASLGTTAALTASPTPAATKVKIFMIAEGDNGASGKLIGCGDSAVAVEREVPQTQAVLKAAMEQLVSIKDKNYGQSGLYNALYQSSLNVDSVAIDANGKATIKLSGTLQLVGTCEDPRLEAQLRETALQFSNIQSVDIFINDQNLRDLISQAG